MPAYTLVALTAKRDTDLEPVTYSPGDELPDDIIVNIGGEDKGLDWLMETGHATPDKRDPAPTVPEYREVVRSRMGMEPLDDDLRQELGLPDPPDNPVVTDVTVVAAPDQVRGAWENDSTAPQGDDNG